MKSEITTIKAKKEEKKCFSHPSDIDMKVLYVFLLFVF